MARGVRCMWMRGGTSKGGYFLREDLPPDPAERDRFLLRVMGSPDPRQIDGMGGATSLTSKVAIVSRSQRPGIDVDYLFLQIFVDEAIVTDRQNCGNMLVGVAPFAIERGLVAAKDGETPVTIFTENTGHGTVAWVATPGGKVVYAGDAGIDGVPGTAAPIRLEMRDLAGSSCGALLPTGLPVQTVAGVPVTLIDNGMPCIVIAAAELGVTGYEDCAALEANHELKERIEAIRLEAGPLMGLGDVTHLSVPKILLVAPPRDGGIICVRAFIPRRVHAGIGVLAAVTAGTACLIDGTTAAQLAKAGTGRHRMVSIEHPAGQASFAFELNDANEVESVVTVRTARKLMDGEVFGEN